MTDATAPRFERHVGIDYSGAQVATASLPGLRVYLADRVPLPVEVPPPSSPRKYWTRRGIAEWLVDLLSERRPTLVGIDHGFSFLGPPARARQRSRDVSGRSAGAGASAVSPLQQGTITVLQTGH